MGAGPEYARRPAIAGLLGDDVRAWWPLGLYELARPVHDMRASGRLLGLYELAGLVHDDLSVGDLRRIWEGGLELLLAHPVGRDAG